MVAALPEGLVYRAVGPLGNLWPHVYPRRHWVKEHLNLAFGSERSPEEIRRITTGFYRHLILLACETLWLERWSHEKVLAVSEFHGLEHMDRALAQGKGVIVVTGHIGNWEMAGAMFASKGYGISIISQAQRDPLLERHMRIVRERFGINIIRMESPRDIFRRLRANDVIPILIDQRGEGGAVLVPFFGQPATSAVGPARIALGTGTPVLSGWVERVRPGHFSMRIGPQIPLIETGDLEHDLQANMARFQQEIEAAIRQAPDQWLWNYRRWRIRKSWLRSEVAAPEAE